MDTTSIRVAVIGGGNMGGAIVRGMVQGKLLNSEHISVSDINETILMQLKEFAPELHRIS